MVEKMVNLLAVACVIDERANGRSVPMVDVVGDLDEMIGRRSTDRERRLLISRYRRHRRALLGTA